VPDQSEFASQLKNLLLRNTQALLDPYSMFERIRLGVTKTQPLLGTLPGNEQGASFVLFLKPSKGSLRVVVRTQAQVFIDGSLSGRSTPEAPLSVSDLEPGERHVSLRFADRTEEFTPVVLSRSIVAVESVYQPVKPARLVPQLSPGNGVVTARFGGWSSAPIYPVSLEPGQEVIVAFAGG
jgi:hypothetical protein